MHTHIDKEGVTRSVFDGPGSHKMSLGNRNEHRIGVKISSLIKQILPWTEILSPRSFSIPLTNLKSLLQHYSLKRLVFYNNVLKSTCLNYHLLEKKSGGISTRIKYTGWRLFKRGMKYFLLRRLCFTIYSPETNSFRKII